MSEAALREASKDGDAATINKLLADGVKQTADENGDTPLILATSSYLTEPKHVEAVRSLLEGDANINVKNNDGNTALHNAAANGNLEIVELLLDNGADMEIEGELKMVPLGLAATKKQHAVVNFFVTRLKDEKKFSEKQVTWMNNAENETQQLHIYRALTSIFHEKDVVKELIKFNVVEAILRGMKKFSKKNIQTSALQLLSQITALPEGVEAAKKCKAKEITEETCKPYASDPVVEHLLKNLHNTL